MGKKQKFKSKPGGNNNRSTFASKVGDNVMGFGNKGKKHNPFELHINRVKYDVIGRKKKEDRGLPGIAKAKANKKREKTLLEEYKQRHKSNVFVDRRIGENDSTMDPEKKIALRMTLEHKRQLSKKSLFNLNDDEELTHGGLALDDNNLKDHIDSDDEDDQTGMLDSTFVKDQHFGGGLLTRKEDGTENSDKPKTKKEWIDEIIAESKRKKQESKQEKEEQRNAVSKLDKGLLNFMHIMAAHQLTDEDKEKSRKTCEFREYDMLFKELGFDRAGKAKAVNRLKNPEEIAKEEAEKLRKLEQDRLRRMKGEEEPEKKPKAYSADDLDDGFKLEKDDRFHLSYKEGKMLTTENAGEGGGKAEEEGVSDEDEEDEGNESDQESGEEGEDDNEDINEGDGDGDGDDDDDDDDDASDQYSDIMDDEDDTEEKIENNNSEVKEKKVTKKKKKKEIMEAAKKEIPYTFEVPQDYEAFWPLLEGRSPSEVGIVLERMISCNHPSLGGKNKEKCDSLFAYLLQTVYAISGSDGDSPVEGVSGLLYINCLIPALYTLTQVSPNNTASALITVLDEKYEEFCSKKVKRYPEADTMLFLKLSGLLFPATDFLHPVMTPVVTFLSHLLGQAKVTSKRELNAALFTASLLHEYISLTGRFVPELSNVLNGLLFLALPGKDKRSLPHTPPFKPVGPTSTLLTLTEPVAELQNFKLTLSSLNEDDEEMSDSFKVKVIHESLQLLKNLCKCWSDLPTIRSIMTPTKILLDEFPLEKYPDSIKDEVKTLQSTIAELKSEGPRLVKKEGAPKALKMYEPAIEQVIDGVKKRSGTKEYQEKQKLMHKLKRERKGAAREIKRDTAFLARKQLEERLKSDAERKRKVNVIMGGLAHQEGDWNKMKRQKK